MFSGSLRSRIMTSYLVVITFCLLLINLFVYITLQNDYVFSKKDELMSYARTLADVSIEAGIGQNKSGSTPNNNYSDDLINGAVSSIGNLSEGRVIILNKDGLILEDSQGADKGKKISKTAYDTVEVETALNGDSDWGQHNKILYVTLPIKIGGRLEGAVLISRSLDNIYAKIITVQKKIALISFFVLAIVGLFSFIMAGIITGPIKKVIGAIESMAEGELDQKVEVKGTDEIAKLSNAFNNMNEKINLMDQERRQFVADASHELKSPLASIKVLVQSLLAGGMNDKNISSEFLENIDKELDRLASIIGNLLELTKLEGSYGIKVEMFDLNDLCNDVIKKINPIASIRNVKIRYEGSSILMEGNRDNIYRAVYNLVENAVKYSNNNSFVDVWTEQGEVAKIYVKDTGIGIPEADIPKIFERFYRVDKTRDRKTGGSGLGLSITNEIIKRHGGEIEVNSKVGEGSLFIINLPYKFEG